MGMIFANRPHVRKFWGKESKVRVRNKGGGNEEGGRRSDAKRDRSERKHEAGRPIIMHSGHHIK